MINLAMFLVSCVIVFIAAILCMGVIFCIFNTIWDGIELLFKIVGTGLYVIFLRIRGVK